MATGTGVERAREWLRRNQLGHIEPSPLLADRLEARRRGNWINGLTLGACFLILAVVSGFIGRSGSALDPDESEVGRLGSVVLTNLSLLIAMGAGLWYAYQAERRLIQASRTRTAHPAAAGVTRVLGRRYLAAVAVVYGGGLLLGAVAALLASGSADRALALAFLGSVAVLTAVSGLALAGVLRRPSVAEDSESLLVDDVLRTQDARAVVMPFPLVVAVIAAVGNAVGPWLMWSFLGYTVLGAACWAAVAIACRLAGRRVEVAR